jgi:hypothetical protein
MITRTWVDPNFRFKVSDPDGQTYDFIGYGETEAALRQRLQDRGFTIERIAPYDFSDWQERAKRATDAAIQDHRDGIRPIRFDQRLWKELKWHLFELFRGKCGYCEWRPQTGASGDVEHFRPRHKVHDDPGHPGYYWLAYDVRNLLPSCELCNRARGKMTHFPVADNLYAYKPEDLPKERPLLLNPFDVSPESNPLDHLDFDKTGLVIGRTPRGELSRELYHLNRIHLMEARREAQAGIELEWSVRTIAHGFLPAYVGLREELRLAAREYSAALLSQLEKIRAQRLAELSNP